MDGDERTTIKTLITKVKALYHWSISNNKGKYFKYKLNRKNIPNQNYLFYFYLAFLI